MNATAAQQITPDGITPDGIYHQVWQATGFDATSMPEPGASIVVAGAVGSAVDDLLAACARRARRTLSASRGGARSSAIGPAVRPR